MIKTIKEKFTFLIAIVFATVVGGVSTAVVMAAIPGSGGVINGCYGKLAGNLRVIDSEAGKTCTGLENPISWGTSGAGGASNAQIAHAAFNSNGTLDTTYSEGIIQAEILPRDDSHDPNYIWPESYIPVCFEVAFEPRVAGSRSNGETGFVPSDKNFIDDGPGFVDMAELIEETCGEGFNALFFGVPDPGATGPETYTYYFLR
jgi:hypothetical protein